MRENIPARYSIGPQWLRHFQIEKRTLYQVHQYSRCFVNAGPVSANAVFESEPATSQQRRLTTFDRAIPTDFHGPVSRE